MIAAGVFVAAAVVLVARWAGGSLAYVGRWGAMRHTSRKVRLVFSALCSRRMRLRAVVLLSALLVLSCFWRDQGSAAGSSETALLSVLLGASLFSLCEMEQMSDRATMTVLCCTQLAIASATSLTAGREALFHFLNYVLVAAPLAVAAVHVGGDFVVRLAAAPISVALHLLVNGSQAMPPMQCMLRQAPVVPLCSAAMACAFVVHWAADGRKLHRVMVKGVEDSVRRQDLFCASMSHELRSPLNGILGSLDLVQLHAPDSPLSEVKEHIAVLRHCAGALSILVENVLATGHGEPKLEYEVVEVAPMFGSIVAALQDLAYRKVGLQIMLSVGEEVPARLVLCRSGMTQAVLNMGANAVKFNDRGLVVVGLAVEHGHLIVRISDDGPGARPAFVPHLFSSYAQDGEFGALGLGLCVCKKLALAMNGTVGYSSQPKTTFWVSVPLQGAAPLQSVPIGTRKKSKEGEETTEKITDVLLVEDSRVNVVVMQKMLSRIPRLSVAVAADGAEALSFFLARLRQAEAVRRRLVVLLDLNMPVLGGCEMLAVWRKLEGVSRVHRATVVIVSATTSVLNVHLDAEHHLPKPVRFLDLKRIMAEAIASSM